MKKIIIYLTIITSIFLIACGGGGSELNVKYGSQEKDFTPTSSFTYHTTKTFSKNANGEKERTSASKSTIYLANFDLDTSKAMISLAKQKVSKAEEVKVVFAILGEAGSSGSKDPIKTGEYLPENKQFKTLENVDIFSYDGKDQKRTSFKFNGMKGKVVIDSVTDEKITGSIDLSDGENSIKGTFTANSPKSSK